MMNLRSTNNNGISNVLLGVIIFLLLCIIGIMTTFIVVHNKYSNNEVTVEGTGDMTTEEPDGKNDVEDLTASNKNVEEKSEENISVSENIQKDEESNQISDEEQAYINEANEFLKEDNPLKAAEVITAALMEGYYPNVYEKLKDIRRNTVDNSEYIKQFDEVSGSLIYEAWLDTVYENDKPVGKQLYYLIGENKTPSDDDTYMSADDEPDYNTLDRDDAGRISKVTYTDETREYEYDDYGRITTQRVIRTNAFGKWITVYEYKYTADGFIISGRDEAENGDKLDYDSTTEEKHDALGGTIEARSHWDEEGEIYGGWAEWTHKYHYISSGDCTLNRIGDDEVWNVYPGGGLSEIFYS